MNDAPRTPATTGSSVGRRLAAGAAIVAIPAVSTHLYLKAQDASARRDAALEAAARYDLGKLREVDPALIQYRPAGRIDTLMTAPRAFALDGSGNLLVAGGKMIRRISLTGQSLGDISLSAQPFCVSAAPDGRVLVGLRDHVEVFDAAGKPAGVWPSLGPDAYITSIAADAQNVYIADSGQRQVIRCDASGKTLNIIGKADPSRSVPGLLLPSPHLDVAIAADGSIWLNNTGRHRMENYAPDGSLERFWGLQGNSIQAFPGCCNPTDFVLLPDGGFITAEKGLARVKKYLPDGRFQGVVAAPSAFGESVLGMDVAVDAAGRVLALERGGSIIQIFAPAQEATR